MLLGCIGDDFTGSTDLANTLSKGGMRVVQYNRVPDQQADVGVEAGVVALKSRTAPIEQAVSASLDALQWLMEQGCTQYFFKYCSTFDSTRQGNIGPVLDALTQRLGASRAIVCPAFPTTGRTIYQGHLFVGDRLLNESGMEQHPLTPMTDGDIRRWLAHQTQFPVGHVPTRTLDSGAAAIKQALQAGEQKGHRYLVVDAIRDADLMRIGEAVADDILVSGGSGVALGLPENFRRQGQLAGDHHIWRQNGGPAAILSGSCSLATRRQIENHARRHPSRQISAAEVTNGEITALEIAEWLAGMPSDAIPLVYSSADPDTVDAAQDRYGREQLSAAFDTFFADLAVCAVDAGISRLIVAGGETSGAVTMGLNIAAFEIGPEIDPGVPALRVPDRELVMALKSGNFGGVDFFERAYGCLGGSEGC